MRASDSTRAELEMIAGIFNLHLSGGGMSATLGRDGQTVGSVPVALAVHTKEKQMLGFRSGLFI